MIYQEPFDDSYDLTDAFGAAAANIRFDPVLLANTQEIPEKAWEYYEGRHNPHTVFSKAPHLSFRQVFNKAAAHLPQDSLIRFTNFDEGHKGIWITPFAGQHEPLFSYNHYPEFNSVKIRRIHAGETTRQSGLGAAMIASQLPLWDALDVREVAVLTHDTAKGFYERLGFKQVDSLPEEPVSIMINMRLDLKQPEQAACFFETLEKGLVKQQALPKKSPARLKLHGISTGPQVD